MKKSLLVVDDDNFVIFIIKKILLDHVDELYTSMNGEEALDVLKKNPQINCIISDLQMPRMNGIELIANIRKNNNKIPFIFLTSYNTNDNEQDALHYGAFDFITKPIVSMEIKNSVHRAYLFLRKSESNPNYEKDEIRDEYLEMIEIKKKSRKGLI